MLQLPASLQHREGRPKQSPEDCSVEESEIRDQGAKAARSCGAERRGVPERKRTLEIFRGVPTSLWLSTDLHLCERKLPEVKERTIKNEQAKQVLTLTKKWG